MKISWACAHHRPYFRRLTINPGRWNRKCWNVNMFLGFGLQKCVFSQHSIFFPYSLRCPLGVSLVQYGDSYLENPILLCKYSLNMFPYVILSFRPLSFPQQSQIRSGCGSSRKIAYSLLRVSVSLCIWDQICSSKAHLHYLLCFSFIYHNYLSTLVISVI